MKKFIQNFYLAIAFLLLYAPIFVLMLFSFNDSKSRVAWHGFTLDWYVQMFQDERILHSLYVTLFVAVISAIFATVLGTAAAIGIQKMGRRSRGVYLTVNNIPMSSSDTIMGVSFMLLFGFLAFEKGYLTLILAHVTFCIPESLFSLLRYFHQLQSLDLRNDCPVPALHCQDISQSDILFCDLHIAVSFDVESCFLSRHILSPPEQE